MREKGITNEEVTRTIKLVKNGKAWGIGETALD